MTQRTLLKFAIIGQPNEGKTTVVATLSEDDQAEIGPRPGTTRKCQVYPVKVDGCEVIRFIDTPGFEDADDAVEWFKAQAERSEENLAAQFIREHASTRQYRRECELLRPIAEGAAIIYVVDASRPVHPIDRDEITILRLCGNSRIAVINSKGDDSEYLVTWRRLLARDFPCVHRFDAHRANFADRMRLLEAIKTVTQEWQSSLETAIEAFKADWEDRLLDVSDAFCEFLKEVMTLRIEKEVRQNTPIGPIQEQAKLEFQEAAKKRERRFRKQVRNIFKHSLDHWNLPDHNLLGEDLFSKVGWKVFGLPQGQLIYAGTLIGATIGGLIDLHAGGLTLLMGTLIGGGSGGIFAWLSADKAVDVSLPSFAVKVPGSNFSIKVPRINLGNRKAQARANPQSNLVWVLTDRALNYVELAASWSHGLRDQPLPVNATDSRPLAKSEQWNAEDRQIVMNFVAQYRVEKPDPDKQEEAYRSLRETIRNHLRKMTGSLQCQGGVRLGEDIGGGAKLKGP